MNRAPLLLILAPLVISGLCQSPSDKELLPAGRGRKPFDVTIRKVNLEEILGGGPARDGIPALTDPEFVSAEEADHFLSGRDRVLGIVRNGVAKAYPVKILNWHEVVNDTVGGDPVMVSW